VTDQENAYDTIAKLRAGLAIEKQKRHMAESELDVQDDKIAELRLRIDRVRAELAEAKRVAAVADEQTQSMQESLSNALAEVDRLRAAIEAESPAEALLYALTDRDSARRDAAVQRVRAERAERRARDLANRNEAAG